ncbi:Nucleotide-binding universal stress protein, UspA family [Planococcus glaciei]|uniref:universal stress protein n=1 Tax=Planococcus glaciei TaxID=459472 RepID=UPI000882D7A4|nr:universal stress protein [Planococcus glaciei]SDH48786.1 Nucleotide-binding universal stress protein, UspA family [Planococcus glaciei]
MANHYQNIVVAIDGSQEAEYAFRKSIDVATRNAGAVLNLVNVIDTRAFEAYERTSIDSAQQTSEEMLNRYKAEAERQGIKDVKLAIEYGAPKTVITKELSNLTGADLIICGATGVSGVERFLLGSVSESIVRSAKCDVLVIRTPE